ncbi:magnesium/cobalt transporter CorA [bacterium]|nr:magnesium/cobalt transporter CorA [bacterium]
MHRKFKNRRKKVGLPPGSLVYIGEPKDEVKIRVINYDKENIEKKEFKRIYDCSLLKANGGVTWIDVVGIHQVEIVQKIGECFELHPLVLEDILATDQRPKIEEFPNYIFVVFKVFHFKDGGELEPEQICFVLFPNLLISFQERESRIFQSIEKRLNNSKDIIRTQGVDYLFYSLLDAVIDDYFLVVDKLGEEIEPLEEKAITQPIPPTIQSIHHLRRRVLLLRENLWALRDIIAHYERGLSDLVSKELTLYFRDLRDHIFNSMETTETIREMLASVLDIYLSSVSNRLNEIMKILTVIATIFMPLTFIVGIYGMNLKYMPEINWKWTYPIVWAVMLLTAGGMYVYFKRKGWL